MDGWVCGWLVVGVCMYLCIYVFMYMCMCWVRMGRLDECGCCVCICVSVRALNTANMQWVCIATLEQSLTDTCSCARPIALQTPHPGLPPARLFGLAYTTETVVITGTNGFALPPNVACKTTHTPAAPMVASWPASCITFSLAPLPTQRVP